MKRFLSALDRIIAIFAILLMVGASAKTAYAYADPGTGLLLVQILTTSFAGTVFVVRKRIRRLIQRITGFAPGAEDSSQKRNRP